MKELIYQKIYNDISNKIITGTLAEGARLNGVRELSEEWKTSANTVLKALDALAKAGFIKKTRGSGIFIQPKGFWHISETDGSNIEMFLYNLDNLFNQKLVSSVERAASGFSYNLQIKTFKSLRNLTIPEEKAVIIVPSNVERIKYQFSAKRRMPLIFAGEFSPPFDFNYNYAVADVYEGFFSLAELLIKSGRKVISYIGTDDFEKDAGWVAYSDVCSGLHKGSCRDYSVAAEEHDPEQGIKAMKKLLLSEELPDAVICRSEALAAGAMSACKKAGLVIPDDIMFAVGGSQGIPSLLDPSPLTLKMPTDAIGYSIVSFIDDILKNRTSSNMSFKAKFSLELFQKESTLQDEGPKVDELYWV